MSLFRAGLLPAGVVVGAPVWQNLQSHRTGKPGAAEEPEAEVSPAVLAPLAGAVPSPGEDPDAILNEARLQAAEILQHAAAEVEEAIKSARQEGFEAGRQEGLAAGQAELESQRQAAQFALEKAQLEAESLRREAEADARAIRAEAEAERQRLLTEAREEAARLAEEARAQRASYLDAARDAVVELAVAAAARLVQGQLALQPEAVVNMVAAGLRRLRDSDCTVRLCPADLPLVTAQRAQLERELGEGHLTLQADQSLSPGSYLIHSPQGSIDGTLEAQTGRLREAMTAALGRE